MTARPWRAIQKHLEGEKYVTISSLDIMVESAFDILLEVGVNTDISVEIPVVASSMENDMYGRLYPEDATYSHKGFTKATLAGRQTSPRKLLFLIHGPRDSSGPLRLMRSGKCVPIKGVYLSQQACFVC